MRRRPYYNRLALETWAHYVRWMHHLKREPYHLTFTLTQPVIWLLLFGNLMSKGLSFPGYEGVPYLSFMLPGVVAFTVMGNAISAGIPVLFDREDGSLGRMLTTPASRMSLLLGRYLYVASMSTAQALIILGLGTLLGAQVQTGAAGVAAILGIGLILGLGFSVLSLALAFVLKDHGSFFAIMSFVSLPLFFTSTALAPSAVMPHWMAVIASANPMSLGVDAFRSLVLTGWEPGLLLSRCAALIGLDIVCLVVGAWVFRGTMA